MICGSIVSGLQELGHSEVVDGERCTQRKYWHFLFFEIVNTTTKQDLIRDTKCLKSINFF